MNALDHQIDASLRTIERRRKTKLTLVVAGLLLATCGMVAVTALMYSSETGAVDAERIGAESMQPMQ